MTTYRDRDIYVHHTVITKQSAVSVAGSMEQLQLHVPLMEKLLDLLEYWHVSRELNEIEIPDCLYIEPHIHCIATDPNAYELPYEYHMLSKYK